MNFPFCFFLCFLIFNFSLFIKTDEHSIPGSSLTKEENDKTQKAVAIPLHIQLKNVLADHSPSELKEEDLKAGRVIAYRPDRKYAYDPHRIHEDPDEAYERRSLDFIGKNLVACSKNSECLQTVLNYFRNWDWEQIGIFMKPPKGTDLLMATINQSDLLGTTALHELIAGPTDPNRRDQLMRESDEFFHWLTKLYQTQPKLRVKRNKAGFDYLEFAKDLYDRKAGKKESLFYKQYEDKILARCKGLSDLDLNTLVLLPLKDELCLKHNRPKASLFATLLNNLNDSDLKKQKNKEISMDRYNEIINLFSPLKTKLPSPIKRDSTEMDDNLIKKTNKQRRHATLIKSEGAAFEGEKPKLKSAMANYVKVRRPHEKIQFADTVEHLDYDKDDKPSDLHQSFGPTLKRIQKGEISEHSKPEKFKFEEAYFDDETKINQQKMINEIISNGESIPVLLKMFDWEISEALICSPAVVAIMNCMRSWNFPKINFIVDNFLSTSETGSTYIPALIYGPDEFKEPKNYKELLNIIKKLSSIPMSQDSIHKINIALQERQKKYPRYALKVSAALKSKRG